MCFMLSCFLCACTLLSAAREKHITTVKYQKYRASGGLESKAWSLFCSDVSCDARGWKDQMLGLFCQNLNMVTPDLSCYSCRAKPISPLPGHGAIALVLKLVPFLCALVYLVIPTKNPCIHQSVEVLLSPPFVAHVFVETFLLPFTVAARLSSSWALALLIFSLYNFTTSLQSFKCGKSPFYSLVLVLYWTSEHTLECLQGLSQMLKQGIKYRRQCCACFSTGIFLLGQLISQKDLFFSFSLCQVVITTVS